MAIGFFDGNKADASPESIKRKRAMIAKMMASSRAPRNIGEGLNSIGDSIASSILGYQADKAERANEAERASIMGGINFGGAPVAAVGGPPVASGPSTPAVTPTAGTGILSFANQGATRNMPIVDELQSNIQTAVSTVYGPNYRAQVYSGGQPGIGSGGKRVGSTRHDHGNAADVYIIDPQGKRVTGDKLALLGRHWLQNGKGGVGMEMKGGGIHLDVHKNRAPIWTYGAVSPAQAALVKEFGGRPPRIIQTASAGPQANDAQMQDGAGELQAGGSEMMGGGYNPFLPRDMAPTADAMGQGIADNEEQTRIMEAQMAAEQGVPYAGNEPGQFNSMFSPDLMGGGLNPFVPRDMVQPEDAIAQAPVPMLPQMDRATFDAITGQMPPAPNMDRRNFDQITNTGAPLNPAFTGQQAGLAPSWGIGDPNAPPPSAQEVSGPAPGPFPTPPRRPANLGPQSPFVPQAMRQPIAPMEASENGAGAMQFIESEFARREGRPDPRTAMGAPGQIYNPFVQQPTQAPQMPAGGGSMPMGGAPAAQAQARPQGGMITPEQFRAAMTSRFTTDADKRLVLDEWNQQQARAQADADRARTQAQNEAAARAAGLDPALLGNPVIGKAATEAKFREAPETFRNLTPAERLQNNIDPNDKRPYQISNKTGKVSGGGGTQIFNNMRTEGAIQPGYRAVRDPQGNVERIEPIPGSQQERDIKEAEEKKGKSTAQDARYANVIFRSVADIDQNMKGSWFPTTGSIGQALSGVAGTNAHNVARAIEAIKANIGFERLSAMRAASPTGGALGGIAVKELDLLTASAGNLEQSQSADQFRRNLERLRSDFEMVIHGRTFSPEERKRMAASEAAQADQGRARPNFIDQNAARPQPTPAQSSAALQNARKAIADGAPREAVMDRLRQAGIDPGGL